MAAQSKKCQNSLKTRPFLCTLCNSSFKLKGGLKRHLGMHLKMKPYMCVKCDTYITSRKMASHPQDCAGYVEIKHFSCTQCNRSFTKKFDNLRRHLETHLKIKKFQCPNCKKSFHNINTFRTHIKTTRCNVNHDMLKIYKCDLCN